jgi:hypothetical protein
MGLPERKKSYEIYPAVRNEILVISCDSRAEDYLRQMPHGIRVFKFPAWRKDISFSVAEKQIKSLLKSRDLKKYYKKVNGLTITALALNGADFRTAESFSKTALNAVEKALALIKQIVKANPELKSRPSGQPPKRVAYRLAQILAEEYFLATGRAAAVSVDPYDSKSSAFGPYLDLVKTTFDALNIDASAEAMGKKAAEHWQTRESGRGPRSRGKIAIRGKRKKSD